MNKPSIEDFYTTIKTLQFIKNEIRNGNLDGWGFTEKQLGDAVEVTHSIKNIYYPL